MYMLSESMFIYNAQVCQDAENENVQNNKQYSKQAMTESNILLTQKHRFMLMTRLIV